MWRHVISFENFVEFSSYLRNHVTPCDKFNHHMSDLATFILTSSKNLTNLQHSTSLLKPFSSMAHSLIVWNIWLLQTSYFIKISHITYKAGCDCIYRNRKKSNNFITEAFQLTDVHLNKMYICDLSIFYKGFNRY